MLSGMVIVAVLLALLAYWFRRSCAALLQGQAERHGARSLPEIQSQTECIQHRIRQGADLDLVHSALGRDFQVISFVLRHGARFGIQSLERRLLVWDFLLMQAWYQVTRRAAPGRARQALTEMASVLAVLSTQITAQPAEPVRAEARL
jgi:hypothetical protein